MKMPELIPVSGDEYKCLLKIMRNWTLMGLGAVLLFVITILIVYFKLGNDIILGFLMIIQFGLIVVAIIYLLKNRKLIMRLRNRARNA